MKEHKAYRMSCMKDHMAAVLKTLVVSILFFKEHFCFQIEPQQINSICYYPWLYNGGVPFSLQNVIQQDIILWENNSKTSTYM